MRATRALTGSATPSMSRRALWPTRTATESAGLRAASSSSWAGSTISTMRASGATRSPGCASRCAIWPPMGARSTVSASALRTTSTPACAARWLARADSRLASELSSAVREMKPWFTSAALLSYWRWAMSTCARAASACCWAWRRRSLYSVGSTRAITWPAFTASPSRTVRPCSSPGTRALTSAECTALSVPVIGTPVPSATWRA